MDTTNFRRDTHNLDSGERLHVVEGFTRVDAKTLRYRVTVGDPDTWARSRTFSGRRVPTNGAPTPRVADRSLERPQSNGEQNRQ